VGGLCCCICGGEKRSRDFTPPRFRVKEAATLAELLDTGFTSGDITGELINRRFERTEGNLMKRSITILLIFASGLLASAIARVLLAADAEAKMPAVPPVSK